MSNRFVSPSLKEFSIIYNNIKNKILIRVKINIISKNFLIKLNLKLKFILIPLHQLQGTSNNLNLVFQIRPYNLD